MWSKLSPSFVLNIWLFWIGIHQSWQIHENTKYIKIKHLQTTNTNKNHRSQILKTSIANDQTWSLRHELRRLFVEEAIWTVQCMCVSDLGDDTLWMGSGRLVGTLCTEIEKVEGTTGGVHGIRPHHILIRHHRHTQWPVHLTNHVLLEESKRV